MNDLDKIGLIEFAENAPIGIVIHNLQSVICYANPAAIQLLDADLDKIIGQFANNSNWHFVDEFGSKLSEQSHPVYNVANTSESIKNQVIGMIYGDKRLTRWFSISAYLAHRTDSEDVVVAYYTDITLQKSQLLFQDIVENSEDAVIVTTADYLEAPLGPNIVYVNRGFESLTGYTAKEAIGKTPRILQGKDTDELTLERMRKALEKQQPIRESILNYGKNGRPYWLDINIVPIRNKFDKVTHFAAIQRDITRQRFNEELLEKSNNEMRVLKDNLQQIVENKTAQLKSANFKLRQLASYDHLTKLPNRRSFQDCFARQLAIAKRNNKLFLIGLIDLDNFKDINDQYGHEFGDQILVSAAGSIMEVLRTEDCVGRLGGE
jgi:PAS domain S-box-containing protein